MVGEQSRRDERIAAASLDDDKHAKQQ
jgi:hypothetical protein